MVNFGYTPAAVKLATGALDLSSDVFAILVNAGSDAATLRTATVINDFISLNEHSDASYSREQVLNLTVVQDDVNFRAEIQADDVVWSSLAGAQVIGMLLYKKQGAGAFGDDAQNIPIGYVDTGGFPKTPQGADFTVQVNAEGMFQLLT